MGLNLDDKKAVVAEVSAEVAKAQTIVVAEYSGMAVVQLTKLRAQARKSGVYLRVLKNTLVRRGRQSVCRTGCANDRAVDLWHFCGSRGGGQGLE